MTRGMTLAKPDDQDAIDAFLLERAPTSMFPLTNLRNHGLCGGHPRACQFWISQTLIGITDVLARSQEGLVFPQCPSGNWAAAAACLNGLAVKGFIGPTDQVTALRAACAFAGSAQVDACEPSYALQLVDLIVPDHDGFAIAPLQSVSTDLLVRWRAAYVDETLGVDPADAEATAKTDIASYTAADSHRVLLHHGTPVAMTGFNATLPQIVQIGGVYTPPDLRGRGFARTALALHLAQAHVSSVQEAVLFAANTAAEKAYRAIGFQRTGSFTLAIYKDLHHV